MLEYLDEKKILMLSGRDLLLLLDTFYEMIKHEHDIKEDEWIDAETAKSILKVKSTTLYKLRSSNAIKISQFGSNILYSRSSINEFISKNIKTL